MTRNYREVTAVDRVSFEIPMADIECIEMASLALRHADDALQLTDLGEDEETETEAALAQQSA